MVTVDASRVINIVIVDKATKQAGTNHTTSSSADREDKHLEVEVHNNLDSNPETNGDDVAIKWSKTMGYMTNTVTAKTLTGTTQCYPTCVESKVRKYPKQQPFITDRSMGGLVLIYFSLWLKAYVDSPVYNFLLQYTETFCGLSCYA